MCLYGNDVLSVSYFLLMYFKRYLRFNVLFCFQAKQRASVAWIVQKAHKNKVPTDLQDPYYRDYEVSTLAAGHV